MTFEGHNIRIIAPLDPSIGPRYIEPIRAKEEAKNIDDFYKMKMTQCCTHNNSPFSLTI